MKSRALILALAVAVPPLLTLSPSPTIDVRDAAASVSVLVSLEELVAASTYVVVATAGERRSVWEQLPSGRRIVTYTRLAVERSVAGAPGGEVWVRTLGGVVDRIGQSVSGEAQIPTGSRSLLFLSRVNGVVVVTAMAQGHYRIVSDERGRSTLAPSPDAGALLPRKGPTISARERLAGAELDGVLATIQQAVKARNGDQK